MCRYYSHFEFGAVASIKTILVRKKKDKFVTSDLGSDSTHCAKSTMIKCAKRGLVLSLRCPDLAGKKPFHSLAHNTVPIAERAAYERGNCVMAPELVRCVQKSDAKAISK